MQKITPFLWFDTQAEDAMKFYTSVFKNSKAGVVTHYGEAGPAPKGTVMTASFELEGLQFTTLNGGPHVQFNHAISMLITCGSQEEVDYYWDRLGAGGKVMECGWVTDKFGVTWQVIPAVLMELLSDPDREKANRVMQAMLQMVKIDIATLQQAAKG